MLFVVFRLYRFYNLDAFGFLWILLFGAITFGVIYLIDFIYRKMKGKEKKSS
jgi:uncharacterized membrane protein